MVMCIPHKPIPLLHWGRLGRTESQRPPLLSGKYVYHSVEGEEGTSHTSPPPTLLNDLPGIGPLSVWAVTDSSLTGK